MSKNMMINSHVEYVNKRIMKDGKHEMQAGARVKNEGLAVDGCKTQCTLQITISGPIELMPSIEPGDDLAVFLDD